MALHVRAQIRQHVAALLAPIEAVEGRVEASRVFPWQAEALPAIGVYTLNEPTERSSLRGPRERHVDLVVEIHAAGLDMDDQLDAIAAAVEAIMDGDRLLGGLLAQDLRMVRTAIGLTPEGEQRNGIAQIFYVADYRTAVGVPTTAV